MKDKIKIFFSYTLRDYVINLDFLINLNNKLQPHCIPFIDVIHNKSTERQKKVIDELLSSKMIILLKTKSFRNSKWVNYEINLAKYFNIPIKGILIKNMNLNDIIFDKIIAITK